MTAMTCYALYKACSSGQCLPNSYKIHVRVLTCLLATSRTDDESLHRAVVHDGLCSSFLAKARLLNTSEGTEDRQLLSQNLKCHLHDRLRDDTSVDSDHTCLESIGHAEDTVGLL
jgi:hypothetical protein